VTVLDLRTADEAALVALGEALALALAPGTVVHLRGDLGAGKTTLVRGIARGLGHGGAVKSPTYTLVEPYTQLEPPLYHFDLYRLGDPEELEFMGLRDYFHGDALVCIEWPERGGDFLPAPDLEIRLRPDAAGRGLKLDARSDRGEAALAVLRRSGATSQ